VTTLQLLGVIYAGILLCGGLLFVGLMIMASWALKQRDIHLKGSGSSRSSGARSRHSRNALFLRLLFFASDGCLRLQRDTYSRSIGE
jgi:hypothetical protein